MKRVRLIRLNGTPHATHGKLTVVENDKALFECFTIEREWSNNKVGVSCIPQGKYSVVKTYSPRFKKDLYLIENVPNRSGIRLHPANYARQLNGCIAFGSKLIDIDGDGKLDVTNSRKTHNEFDAVMEDMPFELEILDWF